MNVNQTVRIIPTLKVNNRNLNEVFYVNTLGMKPLLEESAFLSLGDQSGLEKLVLEESPSMRLYLNYLKEKKAMPLKFIHLKITLSFFMQKMM